MASQPDSAGARARRLPEGRIYRLAPALLGPETAHSPNADDLNALYWVMLIVAGLLIVAINAALIGLVMRYRSARGREPRRLRSRRSAQLLVTAGPDRPRRNHLRRRRDLHRERERGRGLGRSRAAGLGPAHRTARCRASARRRHRAAARSRPRASSGCGATSTPTGDLLLLRAGRPRRHRGDRQPRLDRRRPPLVRAGLGGKFDAVPGKSNRTWFKADEEGVYYGASYQFSGASYAAMRTEVAWSACPSTRPGSSSRPPTSRRRRTSSRRRSPSAARRDRPRPTCGAARG